MNDLQSLGLRQALEQAKQIPYWEQEIKSVVICGGPTKRKVHANSMQLYTSELIQIILQLYTVDVSPWKKKGMDLMILSKVNSPL